MEVWILTFDRPAALTRLVEHFGQQGQNVNIFSNAPDPKVSPNAAQYINKVVVNSLNSPESNAWCARSWNSMYMKAFDGDNTEAVFIQDDTDIAPGFMTWLGGASLNYDFLWGPAGDQFHYIKKEVVQKVGWWDERYIGCYCGDADYMKRVYMAWDTNRISIEESHNWGFNWKPTGIARYLVTTYESKTIDPDYDNQHWELERLVGGGTTDATNPTLIHSQQHFKNKWGVFLDNGMPIIGSMSRKMPEIDWYPWFSKKHNFEEAWTTFTRE